MIGTPASADSGSPPRVWGKLNRLAQDIGAQRFTPTRVGKTRRRVASTRPGAVHPHACGENLLGVCCGGFFVGSPPRVWGKRPRPPSWQCPFRFTPTRVGKTRRSRLLLPVAPVHPHACGENTHFVTQWQESIGSPPRVWGKRCNSGRHVRRARFTPTRVGKTGWAALLCL